MGLIKTAILATAGTHAVNKLAEARKDKQNQGASRADEQSYLPGTDAARNRQAYEIYQDPRQFPADSQQSGYRALPGPNNVDTRYQQQQPVMLSDDSSRHAVSPLSPKNSQNQVMINAETLDTIVRQLPKKVQQVDEQGQSNLVEK